MGMHYESIEQLRNVLTSSLLSQYKNELGFVRLNTSSPLLLGKGDVVFRRILKSGNLSTVEETLDSTDPRLLINRKPRGYLNITDTVDLMHKDHRSKAEFSVSLAIPFDKNAAIRQGAEGSYDSKSLYSRFMHEVDRLPPVSWSDTPYGCPVIARSYTEERFKVMRSALLDEHENVYPSYQEAIAKVRKGHAYSVAIGRAIIVRPVEPPRLMCHAATKVIKMEEPEQLKIEYRGYTLLTLDYSDRDVQIKVASNREGMLEALRREKIIQF